MSFTEWSLRGVRPSSWHTAAARGGDTAGDQQPARGKGSRRRRRGAWHCGLSVSWFNQLSGEACRQGEKPSCAWLCSESQPGSWDAAGHLDLSVLPAGSHSQSLRGKVFPCPGRALPHLAQRAPALSTGNSQDPQYPKGLLAFPGRTSALLQGGCCAFLPAVCPNYGLVSQPSFSFAWDLAMETCRECTKASGGEGQQALLELGTPTVAPVFT